MSEEKLDNVQDEKLEDVSGGRNLAFADMEVAEMLARDSAATKEVAGRIPPRLDMGFADSLSR